MRSSYVIGGCIVLASVILNAKDIHSLIQSTNVLGTSKGFVRLGQVNSERTTVIFTVVSDGETFFQVEGSTSDIVSLVKEKVQGMIDKENKSITDENKKLTLEKLSFTKDMELKLTSNIVYESEYQPMFTLSLESETKLFPKDTLFLNYISALEKYNAMVIQNSQHYSFMQ